MADLHWIKNKNRTGFRAKLEAGIVLTYYHWTNNLIHLLSLILFRRPQAAPHKILIFRRGGIGDLITASASIKAIRDKFPQAEIGLLTTSSINKEEMAGLIGSGFTRIHRFNGFGKAILISLRKEQYDTFIELSNYNSSLYFELRSMLLAKRIYSNTGFGWQVSGSSFLSKWQGDNFDFTYDSKRLSGNLSKIGIDVRFGDVTIPSKNKRIALVLSAGRIQNKWPVESYMELTEKLCRNGYEVVVLGAESDRKDAEMICKGKRGVNFAGSLSLDQYPGFFDSVELVIGNDTGLMHFAYRQGCKTITLFSSRDYEGKWMPGNSQNLEKRNSKVNCRWCFSDTCRDNICMKTISADEVFNLAVKHLGKQEEVVFPA